MPDGERFAVLDIGSNTVRFLIAEQSDGRLAPLHSSQVITRLGERMHETGSLSDKAIERTLSGVESLIEKAAALKPMNITATATHAVRSAGNGNLLKRLFKERFSFDLNVIEWEREAELALYGASTVITGQENMLLFDIGGGSTEFIYRNTVGEIRSIGTTLGVVRLSETFLSGAPLKDAEYRKMEEYIKGELKGVPEKLGTENGLNLVGTAGTITAIAAIRYGVASYDPDLINNRVITDGDVRKLLEETGRMSIEERSSIPALENGREDLIIPGMAIVLSVMDVFNIPSLTVSDAGLREGLLLSLIDGTISGTII